MRPGKEYHIIQITLIVNFIPVAQTMEQVQLKSMDLLKEQLLGQIGLHVVIHLQSTIIWNWVDLFDDKDGRLIDPITSKSQFKIKKITYYCSYFIDYPWIRPCIFR